VGFKLTDFMKIAVITPTIENRKDLLEECMVSVQNQTINSHVNQFVKTDYYGRGCGTIRNELVNYIEPNFDWLAFLDDDDVMLPNHLELLANEADSADVIYSDVETVGWQKSWISRPFNLEEIKIRNYIPVTVLIRRSVFEQFGGFKRVFAEDWDLWKRLGSAGIRFSYVPKVTWQYRRIANRPSMLESNKISF
jgi:glycosyltransferase involved in cell wall biosynthesis